MLVLIPIGIFNNFKAYLYIWNYRPKIRLGINFFGFIPTFDNFQILPYLEFIQEFFIFLLFLNYICIIHLLILVFKFTICFNQSFANLSWVTSYNYLQLFVVFVKI